MGTDNVAIAVVDFNNRISDAQDPYPYGGDFASAATEIKKVALQLSSKFNTTPQYLNNQSDLKAFNGETDNTTKAIFVVGDDGDKEFPPAVESIAKKHKGAKIIVSTSAILNSNNLLSNRFSDGAQDRLVKDLKTIPDICVVDNFYENTIQMTLSK